MPSKGMIQRGALIVVEGIDRSGKSTQCDLLVKSLEKLGHPTKLMKFPDRTTTIGKMIDCYLKKSCDLDDRAIHLLFSANRWEASQNMKKDLLEGITLIVDRYAFSGVAYSAAKPGMDIKWCKNSDSGLPQPDLVMFLNLDTVEAKRRAGFGGERYEVSKFQEKVHKNYELLTSDIWTNVNAGMEINAVNQEMIELSKNAIEQAKEEEIGKLWVEEKKLF